MTKGLQLVVLLGGPSAEREVSLRSGGAVAAALESLGHQVTRIDPVPGALKLPAGTEAVFIALHGTYGEDGQVQAELDQLTQKVVAAGLASWSGGDSAERRLIVRGQAHLLEDLKALEDLERIRLLFDDLETRREVVDLLGRAERAEGVRIFIGSENKLFSLSGSSVILSPYKDANEKVIGVLGVIGPTRLNYARIVPVVDYTAQAISAIMARKKT